MKSLLALIVVLQTSFLFAQESGLSKDVSANADSPPQAAPGMNARGFEILSKVNGNDLGMYPDKVLIKVRGKWEQLMLQAGTAAVSQGTSVVEVSILDDGSVDKLRTIESASNQSLDAIARQAISSAEPFEHFPNSLHEKEFNLRFHFAYNQSASSARPACHGIPAPTRPGPKTGTVVGPSVNYHPQPEYSEQARQLKYQGLVTVGGVVDESGAFTNLCLKQATGNGLDEKAIETLKTWKFGPATKGGIPVAAYIEVQVSFHLY